MIAGDLGTGPVLEFHVPDKTLAGLDGVRVVEVAGEDHPFRPHSPAPYERRLRFVRAIIRFLPIDGLHDLRV